MPSSIEGSCLNRSGSRLRTAATLIRCDDGPKPVRPTSNASWETHRLHVKIRRPDDINQPSVAMETLAMPPIRDRAGTAGILHHAPQRGTPISTHDGVGVARRGVDGVGVGKSKCPGAYGYRASGEAFSVNFNEINFGKRSRLVRDPDRRSIIPDRSLHLPRASAQSDRGSSRKCHESCQSRSRPTSEPREPRDHA